MTTLRLEIIINETCQKRQVQILEDNSQITTKLRPLLEAYILALSSEFLSRTFKMEMMADASRYHEAFSIINELIMDYLLTDLTLSLQL
mgnify:FL=1